MRALAAVFAREVAARRIVFPVALAAGFVPLLGSLSYGWSKPDAPEGRILVALVMAAAFAFAFGLLFGGSVIAGETSEKRISFFFSRPIPAFSLWGGKLLAVFALTLGAALLVLVPALLTSSPTRFRNMLGGGDSPRLAALAVAGTLLLVILGAHAVVTIARLRSPWVALDLFLGPALVLLAAAFLRSLLKDTVDNEFIDAGGLNALSGSLVLFVAAVFVALLLGSFVQVAEGRTDARRAHGAFSVVFFGILGTAVALVGGYAGWCASAKATDLAQVLGSVQTAPHGSWVIAGGPLRAWRGGGRFLLDAATGRSVRVRGWNVAFSQDGTRAAWGEPRFGFFEMKDNRSDLFLADLASGRGVATGLETSGWPALVLSPSGRRLAVRDGRTLAAYDVANPANPRQLAAFPVPESGIAFAFTDEDTIRVFPRVFNASNPRHVSPRSARDHRSLPAFEEVPPSRPLRPRVASLPSPEPARAIPRRGQAPDRGSRRHAGPHAPRRPDGRTSRDALGGSRRSEAAVPVGGPHGRHRHRRSIGEVAFLRR